MAERPPEDGGVRRRRRTTDAGLVDGYDTEYRHTTEGGTTACLLSWDYMARLAPRLRAAEITADELDRYRALMLDPRFRAWFYPFVCTRGRKRAL